MTLDQLIAQLPEKFRPWASQYGPVFLSWTAQQIADWVMLAAKGDVYTAYKQVVDALPNAGAIAAGNDLAAKWNEANKANEESIALQRAAWTALVRVMLMIALAAAGL